jgi:GT2 family glycosyltransferase
MPKLAVIVVSTNEATWLRPCLETLFAHAGGADLDVIVADNESTDGTAELIGREFPSARVVRCANRGFGHANNRGYMATDAPYVLFLNPDTEVLDGTFGDLVAEMNERPEVGVIGVKQLTPDGQLYPTIRRFPSVSRTLADTLGERLAGRLSWKGERELDMSAYDRDTYCDWVSGSFMLVRREALDSAGIFDERFFVYSEEVDLCLRIKRAGWRVVHLPSMTIVHHAGKAGFNLRVAAQDAYSRRQYLQKNAGMIERMLCVGGLSLRYVIRAVAPVTRRDASKRRQAARLALLTLLGKRPPPFGQPPAQAVAPNTSRARTTKAPEQLDGDLRQASTPRGSRR